jgi:hypothetical protein
MRTSSRCIKGIKVQVYWNVLAHCIAEVVGSNNNPTRSIITNLGNYGIILSSFFGECRINSAASRFSCLVERGNLTVKLRLPRVIEAQL